MDRCHLGHIDQIDRLGNLKSALVDAVKSLAGSDLCLDAVDPPQLALSVGPNQSKLVSAYTAFSKEPDSPILREQLLSELFVMGTKDATIGYILREHGFSIKHKFPADFDANQAGMMVVLHHSTFLDDALVALRTGLLVLQVNLDFCFFGGRGVQKLCFCIVQ